MSHAAKPIDGGRTPSPKPAEGDALLFLTRTLQFHSANGETEDAFEKLQKLQKALDQQEMTLSSWPDSPSKERICESLAKAKALVAQIIADFSGAPPEHPAKRHHHRRIR